MKLQKLLFFGLFCFLSVNPILSQEKSSKDIINNYLKELKLDKGQEKQFIDVIFKYTPQFESNELNANEYNALMKKETLEIYSILSPQQFTTYKNLKQSIEPNKKYRIGNNKE